MQTQEVTMEKIFEHHLQAFLKNDLQEIMKDYTEQSEVWSPNGAMVGIEAISCFYSYIFTLLPKENTNFEIKQKIAKQDKLYVVWCADSAIINIPIGTDSFQIEDDKILWQSLAAQIIPKG